MKHCTINTYQNQAVAPNGTHFIYSTRHFVKPTTHHRAQAHCFMAFDRENSANKDCSSLQNMCRNTNILLLYFYFSKSGKLNCKLGAELSMCLELWIFELRFCSFSVSLNNDAFCVILVHNLF